MREALHVKLSKRKSALVATAIAAAMLMTACGGSDDNGDGGTAAEGGSFSIYIGEPENPLVPGNTSESEGSQVIEALWTGLVQYSNEDGSVQYTGVADSIESDDATTWTVKLKDGWTFHDGTPVDAASFVDAWNYTALSTNAQGGSYFFANVEGYDALQGETDDAGNVVTPPAATEMSGLKVVDDKTFTDINTAYTDTQGGNLDVLNNIPPDAISSAPDEFGDRYGETPSSSFTYMGFPTYDPRYADKRVRQAFSLAIDREAITEAIFSGTRTPAYSVIAPVVDGSRDDACQYCKVDVEKA